jgi:hypothetical protein
MAELAPMPPLQAPQAELKRFGDRWTANGGKLSRTPPESSGQLGILFDENVGSALATMLGGIPVEKPTQGRLVPAVADCVEVGPVTIVGGVRPQNFDVGYRPDGVRFAFDSKTLNDSDSVGKNFLNMINDLATEATTVHTRFPFALVGFLVALPEPSFLPSKRAAGIGTLERLARRYAIDEPVHMAEAISLVIWHPHDGSIDSEIPSPDSPLRIETFSQRIEDIYLSRYKGLPPHAEAVT